MYYPFQPREIDLILGEAKIKQKTPESFLSRASNFFNAMERKQYPSSTNLKGYAFI